MPTTSTYSMPQHTFFCFADSYCVFLDLKRDLYLCTERRCIEAVSPWLRGWNAQQRFCAHEGMPKEAADILRGFMARDLLVESYAESKDALPTELVAPQRTMFDSASTLSLISCLPFAMPLLLSARHASWSLKNRTTEETVRSVMQRKAKRAHRRSFDFDFAAKLVTAFNTIRYLLPRNYLCLFDSLALLEAFARYDLFPTWVFGVQAEPFEAHCWLQEQDVVLNDSLERAVAFVPIMAV